MQNMSYVADLHIHSRYSRACSPQLNIPNLVEWAKYKGINVLGTGDFLHPLWLAELKKDLTEDGSGFLTQDGSEIKFVLTVEIASMYSQNGRGRRVHNLIFMPDFASAQVFQKSLLVRRATLGSDGRPIVGIPSKELLRLALEASDKAIFVPSHAWTPWFGIFGSESGYDSLEECFEDLTQYIYGVETGLSSDPAMNWRIKELDNRSIVSFSDAHSLPNLGRESTVFEGEFTYDGFWRAIAKPSVIPANAGIQLTGSSSELDPRLRGDDKVVGTIEFYPEEGKYHYTGHRNCNVKYTPDDTKLKGTICPVCKRGLTVGVMERVEKIAGRSNEELGTRNEEGIIKSTKYPNRPGYRMLVPLHQVIAEAFGNAPTSQRVLNEYKKLVTTLGGEIKVLTKISIDEIAKISGERIAEGVDRVRGGNLVIDPGYDGVYGVVKIWNHGEKTMEEEKREAPQLGLFD
ncbi:MAG: endonuclease Q family protein [Candidatus Daviesbacteria bacterium]|nr:endonuclease Q family protein [Candidatus Daviesbacteria bacterium]